jgi:hypothetical protein
MDSIWSADLKDVDTNPHESVKFSQMESQQYALCELFAGGGMDRLGLGSAWNCKFWASCRWS